MSDDEYEIPLRDQRMFGSGLKRKRIQFVSSSQPQSSTIKGSRSNQEVTAAERYLAIVLNKRASTTSQDVSGRPSRTNPPPVDAVGTVEPQPLPVRDTSPDERAPQQELCEICSKPLTAGIADALHHNSLVHQICLQHSHPPSHLDRSRKGLAVLQSYGWDPDRRRGLGAEGEGRLYPVKAQDNPAKLGLGATVEKIVSVPKVVKLDAGKTRQAETNAQRRKDKLRKAFYQDEKVERYLGQLDAL